MGGDLTNVTISGAKDANGNSILPPLERHMSISIPTSSGLSPAQDDVTAAYIRLLQRRDDERNNELVALRAEMAQMKQHMQEVAPATSRSAGDWRRQRQTPPPPPQEQPFETGYRVSVKDHLGFTPEKGDARELILYRQPTTSAMHHSRSHQERSKSRDTAESFTSTYSTSHTKFSRTTASHHSRAFLETRHHVSEHLGEIPLENLENKKRVRRDGKGVCVERQDDDPKVRCEREKSIDEPR